MQLKIFVEDVFSSFKISPKSAQPFLRSIVHRDKIWPHSMLTVYILVAIVAIISG